MDARGVTLSLTLPRRGGGDRMADRRASKVGGFTTAWCWVGCRKPSPNLSHKWERNRRREPITEHSEMAPGSSASPICGRGGGEGFMPPERRERRFAPRTPTLTLPPQGG